MTCTQQKINNDPRSHIPVNSAMVNAIIPYMDMVKQSVESGKITETEGQYLIAEKIAEFDNIQRQRRNENKLLDAMTRPSPIQNTMTSCHAAGNVFNCHSY